MNYHTTKIDYDNIRRRIEEAVQLRAKTIGCPPVPVRLLAASKFQTVEDIIALYQKGQRVFGENYIQEMYHKACDPKLQSQCPEIEWRLIGHLQTNKINLLLRVDKLTAIETIDSCKVADALESALARSGRAMNVMIEVNTGSEQNKSGVSVQDLDDLVDIVRNHCPHLNLDGLMTIGPYYDTSIDSNPYFQTLVECGRRLAINELSFGMSSDFEMAIEMGATEVRIGRVLFGGRPTVAQYKQH